MESKTLKKSKSNKDYFNGFFFLLFFHFYYNITLHKSLGANNHPGGKDI